MKHPFRTIVLLLLMAAATTASAQENTKGRLTVDCDQAGAAVWVDGEQVGQTPMVLELKGQHNIRVEKDINHYYRATEFVEFMPDMDEYRLYTLKKMRPKKYVFLMGEYSLSNKDLGLFLGVCRYWGAFFRVHSNFRTARSRDHFMELTSPLSVRSLEKPYSGGFSGGLMFRLHNQIYAYTGAGYCEYSPGSYADEMSTITVDNPFFTTAGLVDAGLIIKLKSALLSMGFATPFVKDSDFPREARYGDFHVGVGITLHKNRKR